MLSLLCVDVFFFCFAFPPVLCGFRFQLSTVVSLSLCRMEVSRVEVQCIQMLCILIVMRDSSFVEHPRYSAREMERGAKLQAFVTVNNSYIFIF